MDTIKSFKGYGKVDEAEQQAFRKSTRRRLLLIALSVAVLISILLAVAITTLLHSRTTSSNSASPTTPSQSLKAVCSVTPYPATCLSTLQQSNSSTTATSPSKLFLLSLRVALAHLPSPQITIPNTTTPIIKKALHDCSDLFSDAADRLTDAIAAPDATTSDLRTWLSAALTDQETCVDGLSEISGTADLILQLRSSMNQSSEIVSNSLAMVTKLSKVVKGFKIPIHRKLGWVGAARRALEGEEARPAPNAVVAKDGSGNYSTIGEAVRGAPVKSKERYVIYVKEGKYVENVVMHKNIWNVMMYGDGMRKTVVSGSLNFIDGTPTFSTATFIVQGKGFIAKDMGFENTAGASKHQAVAFRSGSDQSVFHRCLFDGYQDTLYAHSNRQFYLGCTITGTIDFIFGNAAVVFQDCAIQPRQPMANQFNTITAQGKKDPNMNTGISIHKCTITPLDALKAPTYLGRPWKDFSTTVVMQSTIGSFVSPVGWIAWVQGVDPPTTIFYGEYENSGPGADVLGRVKWAGYQPSVSVDRASKYTVDSFIDGSSWLGDAQVTYQSTL